MLNKKSPYEKELQKLEKQELKFLDKYKEETDGKINQLLRDKVPDKLQAALDGAFAKAFSLVFQKGTGIIEKTYKKEQLEKDYKVNAYAAECKNTKKEWKAFSKQSKGSANKNLVISGVSGIGLGVLGIGLPDIALFTGLQLRSIYEIALQYGFSYEEEKEQCFILLLIHAALSNGEVQKELDQEINDFIDSGDFTNQKELDSYIKEAAACMSKELLYAKFLQGIPLVGVVGGAFDAIYMRRINKYAELKYRRRFLLSKKKSP